MMKLLTKIRGYENEWTIKFYLAITEKITAKTDWPDYFAMQRKIMKNAYCAYRDWDQGEFDIIVFETEDEMIDFCKFNNDYQEYHTSILTLREAKDIFGEKKYIFEENKNV